MKYEDYAIIADGLEKERIKIILLGSSFCVSIGFYIYLLSLGFSKNSWFHLAFFSIFLSTLYYTFSLYIKAGKNYYDSISMDIIRKLCSRHESCQFVEDINIGKLKKIPVLSLSTSSFSWGIKYTASTIIIDYVDYIRRPQNKSYEGCSVYVAEKMNISGKRGMIEISRDLIKYKSLSLPQLVLLIVMTCFLWFESAVLEIPNMAVFKSFVIGSAIIFLYPKIAGYYSKKTFDSPIPNILGFSNHKTIESKEAFRIGKIMNLKKAVIGNMDDCFFVCSFEDQLKNNDFRHYMDFPLSHSLKSPRFFEAHKRYFDTICKNFEIIRDNTITLR